MGRSLHWIEQAEQVQCAKSRVECAVAAWYNVRNAWGCFLWGWGSRQVHCWTERGKTCGNTPGSMSAGGKEGSEVQPCRSSDIRKQSSESSLECPRPAERCCLCRQKPAGEVVRGEAACGKSPVSVWWGKLLRLEVKRNKVHRKPSPWKGNVGKMTCLIY